MLVSTAGPLAFPPWLWQSAPTMEGPVRLEGAVKSYAWGSRTMLAELRGLGAPTRDREAEIWFGAHARGMASAIIDGSPRPLGAVIDEAPLATLGVRSIERFGPRLPFLLKLLAADEPLSLQAHPSLAQARAGFAREEALGLALDDPRRSYKDPQHKPELLCALTPFAALSGFRAPQTTRALLAALDVAELSPLDAALSDPTVGGALHRAMEVVLAWPAASLESTVAALARACTRHGGPFAREARWLQRVAERYPRDPGVLGALLLHVVELAPGEAVYLDAGNMHAYLHGAGVELMAASDNVIRGGLTEKHVDREELMTVLRFEEASPLPLRPSERGTYETDAAEFALHVASTAAPYRPEGPEIVLVTGGELAVATRGAAPIVLTAGQAAFIPAAVHAYTLEGAGHGYRATVADLPPPTSEAPGRR